MQQLASIYGAYNMLYALASTRRVALQHYCYCHACALAVLSSAKYPSILSSLSVLGLQQHRFTYNEPMPVESCTQSVCDLALRFGEDTEDDAGGMVSNRQCSSNKPIYMRLSLADKGSRCLKLAITAQQTWLLISYMKHVIAAPRWRLQTLLLGN